MINASVSDRLKQVMKDKHLKQVDILKLCKPICEKQTFGKENKKIKISKSDLSQWISGLYEPSKPKLAVLSEALDVNPAWLLGYDVSKHYKNNRKE